MRFLQPCRFPSYFSSPGRRTWKWGRTVDRCSTCVMTTSSLILNFAVRKSGTALQLLSNRREARFLSSSASAGASTAGASAAGASGASAAGASAAAGASWASSPAAASSGFLPSAAASASSSLLLFSGSYTQMHENVIQSSTQFCLQEMTGTMKHDCLGQGPRLPASALAPAAVWRLPLSHPPPLPGDLPGADNR